MNETEANTRLKELAATHRKARLDAQDYRRQRRLILAKFSASDCAEMQETMEWHDPKSRGEDTAELQVPDGVDDTAEIKVVNDTRRYKVWAFTAVSILIGLFLIARLF